MYKWFYRGMTFNSDSSEIYSRGVMKIPKAYNKQGVIWEKIRESYEICFWDWTGRLLLSMPRTQFLKLTAFPANIHPDASWPREKYASDLEYQLHQYLTDDGWTYTLEQAKETALKCGYVDIAAIYKTPNDGQDTVAWLEIPSGGASPQLGGVSGKIDWGDGTAESVSVGALYASHTYSNQGVYTVKISWPDNPSSDYTTRIGKYTVAGTYLGYYNYYYLSTNAYAFGASGSHDGVSIYPLAIYTGHATYDGGALYSAYIRYIGMVRDWDPFSQNYTDGVFEGCWQLDTITFAPGATFPTYGAFDFYMENIYLNMGVHLNYGLNAPFYNYAMQAPMLRNMFLPYGWKGHKRAMFYQANRDNPFECKFVHNASDNGGLGTNGLHQLNPDAPNRLIYPPTTEALLNIDKPILKTVVGIGASSLSFDVTSHYVSDDTKYYIPSGTLDYYASTLPNGQTLKESGRIIEVS